MEPEMAGSFDGRKILPLDKASDFSMVPIVVIVIMRRFWV
jgi:hypothetical protein